MGFFGPSGAAAPQFAGPTPPDRVDMTLEDHLSAVLNYLRSGQATPQDFMTLRAFEEGKQQILMQLVAAQQQPQDAGQVAPGQAVDEDQNQYDEAGEAGPGY